MLPESLWADLVIGGGRGEGEEGGGREGRGNGGREGGGTILWILGYGLLLFRSIVTRPTLQGKRDVEKNKNDKKERDKNVKIFFIGRI